MGIPLHQPPVAERVSAMGAVVADLGWRWCATRPPPLCSRRISEEIVEEVVEEIVGRWEGLWPVEGSGSELQPGIH